MSTARPPKPPARFVLPGTPAQPVPGLVRAAALALAVARFCKAGSWAQFAERVSAGDEATLTLLGGVEVDPEDAALVAEHDHVLRLLNVRPLVTVAVCPACEGWVLTTSTPPTKCRVTARCAGKPVKASIATREKAPSADPFSDLPEDPEDPEDPASRTAAPQRDGEAIRVESERDGVHVEVTVTVSESAA